MEETQARLTEEFAKVCREYCDVTWDKGLDAAGVPSEFALRQPGSVYYHPDICELLEALEQPLVSQTPLAPIDATQELDQAGGASKPFEDVQGSDATTAQPGQTIDSSATQTKD